MRPLGLSERHEQELANSKPMLTSVGYAEVQHRRELDKVTASLRRIEEKQRMAFDRERASVRSWVDRSVEDTLEGVEGLLHPNILDPPILTERKPVTARETVKKNERNKAYDHDEVPLFSLPTSVSGKSTLPGFCVGRKKKTCPLQGIAASQKTNTTPGEVNTMPRGFPLSFEDSGFLCRVHWADVSFQEVLLTALGPRSERERRGKNEPNNRLLVSVACYLLNEVLTHEPKFSDLWSQMRDIIFKAIFTPPTVQQTQKIAAVEPSSCLTFETCQDYKNLHLWSDAFLIVSKEKARLSERIVEMQEVVRKSRLVLRFAQRRVDRMRLQYFFCAWRKTIQRERAFREATMNYVIRVRKRMYIEGCFLRWRRVVARSQVSELMRMLKESEVRLALLEKTSSKTVTSLSRELEEERKSIKILKVGTEALKSQLAESHVLALRVISNELRQHQLNVIAAKKESKRWERLAKTFTLKTTSLMVPPSMRKIGVALRRIEDEFVLNAPTTQDRFNRARSCLERLLLAWVNLFMKNSPVGPFWCRVAKINTGSNDGDFGTSALFRLVRALESFYIKMGALPEMHVSSLKKKEESNQLEIEENQSSHGKKITDLLFEDLKRLLYLQTTEGLFPLLLSHCTFASSFFTSELFCKSPHPTAMLWVLASLFVGYTRLICEEPVIAKNDIDGILRCQREGALQRNVWGLVHMELATDGEVAGTGKVVLKEEGTSQIVASNTLVKKKTRASFRRRGSFYKFKSESDNERKVSLSEDAQRLADTMSDLETYLGIDEEDDESSCGSDKNSVVSDGHEDSVCGATKTSSSFERSSEEINVHAQRQSSDSADSERLRRIQRKARAIPSINDSLCSLSLQEFVQHNQQELNRRRTWLGLSRVVSSLIVRFRILDSERPVVSEKQPIVQDKKVRLLSLVSKAPSVSTSCDSSKVSRKSVRLVLSSNTGKRNPNFEGETGGSAVTLRSILEEPKWLRK